METVIHLDTHVAVWLFGGDERRLAPVRQLLEQAQLVISPAVILEMQLLFEIGRADRPADRVYAELVETSGVRLSGAPFADVVMEALKQSWTRDPFDRLIVASALVDGNRLVTCDEKIHEHCPRAMWG
jgi:PIN domain nuclease of toxin-antitoxin system